MSALSHVFQCNALIYSFFFFLFTLYLLSPSILSNIPSSLYTCPCFQKHLLNHICILNTDTFNLLVPHSKCNGKVDLYEEYASIRGPNLALPKKALHEINVPKGTQPCESFGIHPKMPFLKQLYDDKDAVMIANMGAMVEVREFERNFMV